MAGEDIAEFEIDYMVRDTAWTTMARDDAIDIVDGYSVVNNKIRKDVPLCSSEDWVFGIVAGFPTRVLKSASVEVVMGDKFEETFWFAIEDNMLGLDDDTGVLFMRKDPSSLDPVVVIHEYIRID